MGKIQENMLKVDISQIHDQGNTFFSPTDIGYLIFMIIGIAGYFTVPSVANYIIHAGGGNSLLHKVRQVSVVLPGRLLQLFLQVLLQCLEILMEIPGMLFSQGMKEKATIILKTRFRGNNN